MDQAQTLALRKQLGGGSKWRTWLVLLLLLVGMLLGFYFRFQEIPATYRLLFIAAAVGGGLLFVFFQRRSRKTVPATTKFEVSETGFAVLGPAAKATMPWSAFSQCLESPDLFVLLDRPKRTLVVIPKRAFPDESSQTSFREQVDSGLSVPPAQTYEPPVMGRSAQPDRVTFTVQLRYRDFVDLTLASWFTWAFVLGVAVLIITVTFVSAADPPQDAVLSTTQVFFIFMVPFFLVAVTMIILIGTFHAWRSHAKYSVPQEIALSEESIAFAGADASGTLPWTTFMYYKETWWSFILWRGSFWRCSFWMAFPKRAFTSWDDVSRCRQLLEQHLRRSRWFRG
jgi:YcxB-like protein